MRFLKLLFLASSYELVAECPPSSSRVLEMIEKRLPLSGHLECSAGFVYVDVDDQYIHELAPLIQEEGFEEPPYFENAESVGAHITVIYPGEITPIPEIQECGQPISFVPKTCQVIHPLKLQMIDEMYLVIVESPMLDEIREKYGLPKRQYDFHITIGAKPKKSTATSR